MMNNKFTTDPIPGSYIFNQALVALVLQEASAGKLQRCKALGFTYDLILKLQSLSPTDLHKLISSPYLWIKPSVDPHALEQVLEKIERDDERERLINRALKLGATTPMMHQFFGLSHTESAERRRALGLDVKPGRLPSISDKQRHNLWQRWVTLVQQHDKCHGKSSTAAISNTLSGSDLDEINQLDLMLMIAEEQNILVAQIWADLSQLQDVLV